VEIPLVVPDQCVRPPEVGCDCIRDAGSPRPARIDEDREQLGVLTAIDQLMREPQSQHVIDIAGEIGVQDQARGDLP